MAQPDEGFSLVEVLVAAGLLAGVLLSVGAAVSLGERSIADARQATIAMGLAREILETLIAVRPEEAPLLLGTTPAGAALAVGDTREAGSPLDLRWGEAVRSRLHGGHARVTLVAIGGPAPALLGRSEAMRIDVTVAFRRLGRQRSLGLQGIRF